VEDAHVPANICRFKYKPVPLMFQNEKLNRPINCLPVSINKHPGMFQLGIKEKAQTWHCGHFIFYAFSFSSTEFRRIFSVILVCSLRLHL
jgi:hypothetical protein